MWAGNSVWEDGLACGSSEKCKGQILGFDFSFSEEQKFVPLCKSRICCVKPGRLLLTATVTSKTCVS